jgi:nucleotide-binding universal stress UspA family protein
MFRHILVPTDGSDMSLRAAAAAIELARQTQASLVTVTVVEPYAYASLSEFQPETIIEYEQRSEAMAATRVKAVESLAVAAGVPVTTCVAKSFSVYEAIIDTATNESCDAIFMASHGRRGIQALLLGSETQKVLTHCQLPVVVFR